MDMTYLSLWRCPQMVWSKQWSSLEMDEGAKPIATELNTGASGGIAPSTYRQVSLNYLVLVTKLNEQQFDK